MNAPRVLTLLTAALFLVLLISVPGRAQHHAPPSRQPAMAQVEEAYRQGRLSLDQKVLYKFYAGLQPEKLPKSFLHDDAESSLAKCGTPAHIDYLHHKNRLSTATILEIESISSSRETSTSSLATYLSPSGKFELHYEVAGPDAVPAADNNSNGIPDYVEWTAAAADSSWRHEVQRLGYSDPVPAGDAYDIYFRNFGFYGQTKIDGESTIIEIHNNFENFPENTDPEGNVRGAIKATMAHELKHAIQYANSKWYEFDANSNRNDTSPHSFDWTEMDATLMEEVVYDNVNDYYNYIFSDNSIFLAPEDGVPGAYWQVSWFLFFEEYFGPSFWVNVWTRIKNRYEEGDKDNYLSMWEAISLTLEEDYNTTLEEAFIESQLWHLASGSVNSSTNYGFEERLEYPDPVILDNLAGSDSTSTLTLGSYAANYFVLTPGADSEGFVRIEAARSKPGTGFGIGLIAFFTDGSSSRELLVGGTARNFSYLTPWEWSEVSKIGIVASNAAPQSESGFRIKITNDLPEEVSLSQNYPNPFNPSTIIPFTLSEPTRVQIKVYDLTGRRVATILDEERPAGFYRDVQFNAGNLASGLYFYQLITEQRVLSRKMMLIK